ncbi:uncharacterized protein DS421_16g565060 [Arachis hypogaea]|nr:uncharacterized protein DS421_16g565060 [Arachis hypogaea]
MGCRASPLCLVAEKRRCRCWNPLPILGPLPSLEVAAGASTASLLHFSLAVGRVLEIV